MLLWALAACDDPSSTTPDDETPTFEDEETPTDEDTDDSGELVDAGLSARRDAGRDAARDSGGGTAPDAGLRRDAGASDSAVPDSSARSDAAVPAGEHCAPTASWDPQWAVFEDEVLRLTNEARTAGATCGSKAFPAVKPLVMEERLRCSARLYSEEMVRTNNWGHESADGTKFSERIAKTGYRGGLVGENIAKGQRSPAQVVSGWLKSTGHCENIMQANFTQIGVGYYIQSGAQPHWTQNFGKPL
jgi:uncharacterized protein YkwD